MSSEGLELEHLERLRTAILDAVDSAKEVGATPADVLTCLSTVAGQVIARSGLEASSVVLSHLAAIASRSARAEAAQVAENAHPKVYAAGNRRRRRT